MIMRELEGNKLEERLRGIKFEEIKEEEVLEKKENFKRKILEYSEVLLIKRRSLAIKRKILVSSLVLVFVALIVTSFPLLNLVETAQAKSEALGLVREIYRTEPMRVEVDLKNRSADVYFYNAKVVLDLEKKRVVKVLAPVKEELSQEEKEKAFKIARESVFLKNFAYSEGGEIKVADLSRTELKVENVEGYTFEGAGFKIAKIKLSSEVLPQNLGIFLFVDLAKGSVVSAYSSFNKEGENVQIYLVPSIDG
jgi:hypothetical protein